MWRTRALVSMLVEDIAGLPMPSPETRENSKLDTPAEQPILSGAIRRGRLVILVDCLAIIVLFLFRDRSGPFLPADQTIETVFTLGVLAVAAHAGFRWAQLDRLMSIRRLCEELRLREDS